MITVNYYWYNWNTINSRFGTKNVANFKIDIHNFASIHSDCVKFLFEFDNIHCLRYEIRKWQQKLAIHI